MTLLSKGETGLLLIGVAIWSVGVGTGLAGSGLTHCGWFFFAGLAVGLVGLILTKNEIDADRAAHTGSVAE